MKKYNVAILAESMNTSSGEILKGVIHYIQEHGPWSISYGEYSLDGPQLQWLENWGGDGVILLIRALDTAKLMVKKHTALVDLSGNRHTVYPTVHVDFSGNAQMALEHFTQRGIAHYAYVGIEGRSFSVYQRDAFMSITNGSADVLEMPEFIQSPSAFHMEEMFLQWLKHLPKPCGIFACNDRVGVCVIQACDKANISVPDDVAVLGVDNDYVQCQMSPIPLSSIQEDHHRYGYEAAALLHRLMRGETEVAEYPVIPSLHVVERMSTDILVVTDEVIKRALRLIREIAFQDPGVQEIAHRLGLNRRLLERRFARIMHCSVQDEIRRVQRVRAMELLKGSSLTLDAVARRVGLNESAHFSHVFRRIFKCAPGSVRK